MNKSVIPRIDESSSKLSLNNMWLFCLSWGLNQRRGDQGRNIFGNEAFAQTGKTAVGPQICSAKMNDSGR